MVFLCIYLAIHMNFPGMDLCMSGSFKIVNNGVS